MRLFPLLSVLLALPLLAAGQPNVILIMADDFGYECVASNGGESYQTPNLDRLAAEGIRFEHCHSQPLCTPTRVQLMTGRYNVRNYLNFGTLVRSETTFGHLLQKAGYATGICGKWQLGRETDAPRHFGFHEALLWQHTRRPPRYANAGLELNGVEKDYPEGSYGPTLINDFALDFITRHKDAPFFLYYPMILTHDPFQPTPDSPDWDAKAKGENINRKTAHFADMVRYMDKMIGRVDEHLKQLGIRDNTLLIFTGDNGTHSSITSRFQGRDYQGGKGHTTNNGHHVPLIVSWPAVIKQSRVCGDLVSCADVLPTLCAATGAPLPESVDGVSFLPQLRGEPGTPRDSIYAWHSPRQGPDMTVREYAFDQHYKLYRDGSFFDLNADPLEKAALQEPLMEKAASARSRLQACLYRYQDARPAELDATFKAAAKDMPGKSGKSGKKGKAGKNKNL